jgi:ketosteroid isomerase-like protein
VSEIVEETSELAEIRRLVDAYALAMDRCDLDAFPRLFVPDGALVVRAPGREKPMGVFRGPGPDGVGLIARLLGELYRATLHHITTHEATIDGDNASGTTYCLAYHMPKDDGDGGSLETLGVRYQEQFVRTDDGWRINVRDATRLWSQITPTPFEPLLIDRAAARARNSD